MKNPPADIDTHIPGTNRAEEWARKKKAEPGREGKSRAARDATSINAKHRGPIDPRMPHMPPA